LMCVLTQQLNLIHWMVYKTERQIYGTNEFRSQVT